MSVGVPAIVESEDAECEVCAGVDLVRYVAGEPAPPPHCGRCGRRLPRLVDHVRSLARDARRRHAPQDAP